MSKSQWGLMSWKEVAAAQTRKPVVLFPLGAVEIHGYHVPVGFDYLSSDMLAQRVAERTGSLALPVIPYGDSESLRGFPGTITVQTASLVMMLSDICECLFGHGFDHLVFVCAHTGNVPAMDTVARRIRRERGIITARVDPTSLAKAFAAEAFGVAPAASGGHGGFITTAVMDYLIPGSINRELMGPGEMVSTFRGFRVKSPSAIDFEGQSIGLYLDADEISPGQWGNPNGADAAKGEVVFERAVGLVCRFVDAFRQFDVRTEVKRDAGAPVAP